MQIHKILSNINIKCTKVLGQFGVYVNHEERTKFNILVITVALEMMHIIKIWVKKKANINFHDKSKHGTAFGGWGRQRVLFVTWQTEEMLLTALKKTSTAPNYFKELSSPAEHLLCDKARVCFH
jgi:hypothetical protein